MKKIGLLGKTRRTGKNRRRTVKKHLRKTRKNEKKKGGANFWWILLLPAAMAFSNGFGNRTLGTRNSSPSDFKIVKADAGSRMPPIDPGGYVPVAYFNPEEGKGNGDKPPTTKELAAAIGHTKEGFLSELARIFGEQDAPKPKEAKIINGKVVIEKSQLELAEERLNSITKGLEK